MLPTTHLRLWTDAQHKPPVLQQLWVNYDPAIMADVLRVACDDTGYLEATMQCDWRTIPLVYQPAPPTA